MSTPSGTLRVEAAVGLADLVRAWKEGGDEGLDRVAQRLGYVDRGTRSPFVIEPPTLHAELRPGDPGSVEVGKKGEGQRRFQPIPYWRVESYQAIEPAEEEPHADVEVLGLSDLDLRDEISLPAPTPIVPWSRLEPVLSRVLRSRVESRELDVDRLVERWGRGELLEAVPRRPSFAWSRRIKVVLDRNRRLIPVWADQDETCQRLRRSLGRSAVEVYECREGPGGPWRHGSRRADPPPRPAEGEHVLFLGDLGIYAGAPERDAWRRFGRRLQRDGARLGALVPCSSRYWPEELAQFWGAVDWASPMRARAAGGMLPEVQEFRERGERLLRLASPALWIDPSFLRAVRRLMSPREGGIEAEIAAWNHPEVEGGSYAGLKIELEVLARWRGAFRDQPDGRKQRLVELLRHWREKLPKEVWFEEVLGLDLAGELPAAAVAPEEVKAAREYAIRACKTALDESSADSPVAAEARRWVWRFGARVPGEVREDPELRAILARARALVLEELPEATLAAGITPADLAAIAGNVGPAKPWRVWQVGASLHVLSEAEDTPAAGSLLATVSAALPLISVGETSRLEPKPCWLDRSPRETGLPRGDAIRLESDRERVELRRFEQPPWAVAAGRDEYGLWAAFEVEGVRERLRWIPPGRFWMGSPESEPGRRENEGPRHLVTLAEGFWLGEAPCTQALWQAVMGENPSHFQDPDRPVETVSWNDCKAFVERLNEELPGLEARFPTEAEWEYACRAGTTTSTYAGEMEIVGANKAPILDTIAWYGGNSGVEYDLEKHYDSSGWSEKQHEHTKAGSRRVKLKVPNPWGLYDVLGNVWEWCAAWRGEYDGEAKVDPRGPAEGSLRVIRGGSWSSNARDVRAAARGASRPEGHYGLGGFRLARGQGRQG